MPARPIANSNDSVEACRKLLSALAPPGAAPGPALAYRPPPPPRLSRAGGPVVAPPGRLRPRARRMCHRPTAVTSRKGAAIGSRKQFRPVHTNLRLVFFFAKKLFRSTSISLKRPSSSCSVGFLFETLLLTSRKGANHFNCISSAREKTVSDRASHGVADRLVLRAEEVSQWRPGTAVPGQASRRLSCPGPRAGISVSGLRAQWPSESTGRAFVSTDAEAAEGARPAFGCPRHQRQSHLLSQSQLVMVQVVAIARTMPPTNSVVTCHGGGQPL